MNRRLLRRLQEEGLRISQTIDEYRQFRHVSFVLRNNLVISTGTNCRKTHPDAKRIGYLFDERHSELDALVRIPKFQRYNLALVNFRFNKQGLLRNSKPCKKCLPWCSEVFDEIWYSSDEGMNKYE